MAQLKDILEIERSRREGDSYSTLFLFLEGTFYRAYEWSAWLCCRYVNQFKATRREQKTDLTEDGTVVFVGFPTTSLSKYLPEEAEAVANEDKSVTVTLPLSIFDETDDVISLSEAFKNWKGSVPLAQPKKGSTSLKSDLKNSLDMPPHRLSEVMLKVLAFPIEQKTPMECMNFIAEIKQQIATLL